MQTLGSDPDCMREIIKKYIHGVYAGDEKVRIAVTPKYLSDIKSAYKTGEDFVGTVGSPGKTRTYNPSVNSRMLCH